MLKNKILLCSLVVVATGCSKSKDFPSLLGHLEKNASDDKVVQRELAAIDGERCLKDIFSVSVLKAEVKELEKKYASGTKVKGKWKHLNLEDLPIPQANFLKTYGNNLGDLNNPDAFDYSSCKDVPCIFNKIYGQDDYVAGYVHYLWYLKMGHLLGASNKVYDALPPAKPGEYNGKKFDVSAYLYRERELFGFWRLMQMVKAPHTTLTDLKEIFRVPQGEFFDFEVSGTRKNSGGTVCGLAFSNGYVIMQDTCLSMYDNWEDGNFYETVLHELSHQVDYHEGMKLRKTYRSQEADYLALSHFYLKEYKNEKGETVRQWSHSPGIKLPSSYGGTSPAENFAETLSHFRVDGTNLKAKISEEHWNFTSKNFYFDKSFEKRYLINGWVDGNLALISQAAFKAVSDCSSNPGKKASTYFKKTDFNVPLQAATINCLGSKADEFSRELRSKIKVTSPDGCRVLAEYNVKTDWEPALKVVLNANVNKYLKELQTDKEYFARIQSYVDKISDREMANQAFLACAEAEGEETCYQESVLKLALQKLAPLNLPEINSQELAQMYLDAHTLSDTRQYIMGYYKSFVKSQQTEIDEVAEAAWDKCESLPLNDDASPAGKHFTIGDGYMVSSIYNCLNTDFPESAKLIVRNMTINDSRVQHPKEEVILFDEVVPLLKASLLNLYEKKKVKELKSAQEFIQGDEGSLRKTVLSDFSWVTDVLNAANIQRDCEKHALSKVEFALRYHIRKEVFAGLISDSCRNISETSEYNKWLEDSQSVFAERSTDGLENRVLELARAQADSCLGQYPVDTNLNRIKFKKEREACLVDSWTAIEAKALKEFQADPMVMRFKIDVTAVKTKLETNRRRLQLKIIKEKF